MQCISSWICISQKQRHHLLPSLCVFSGPFEFSWQQFIVGVQSSLIMFPVNILIVSIFRNTRRRETSCCKRKTKKPRTRGKNYFLQTVTTNTRVDVSLDTVIEVSAPCLLHGWKLIHLFIVNI